ncbi:MAG: tyrosine-type recombinase/integrase [Chloroflexia bacterium]
MARREFQMPNVLRQSGPRPYWYIRYRRKVLVGKNQIKKEEKWHRLGYCDEMTKPEAKRHREQVMKEINREVYTIQSHILFKDFVEIFRSQHMIALAPGGKKRDLSLLSNHILPAVGDMRLCDIGSEEVQAFLNTKNAEGLSWWTRKGLQAVISSVFTKAGDWGYWQERNPTARTSVGRKRPKRERRILTDDQYRHLLSVLPATIRLMVETAVSTGMRISEIIGLKWRCIDLERGLARVEERYYRGDTDLPKTEGSKRVLPLGQLVLEYRKLKPAGVSEASYVFERNGDPMDDRAMLRNHIRPAAKRLGCYFEGFGWHSFRRQNITLMQEEGATSFEAQAQAGHARPAMTSEYTIVGLPRREQAVLRLQNRLQAEERSTVVN